MKRNTLALIGMLGAFGASAQAQSCETLCSPNFGWFATKAEIDLAISKADFEATRNNETALMKLVKIRGSTERARMLLDAGADVNSRDWDDMTVLMNAVKMIDVELVKVLLDYGADVNAKAYEGSTALMIAAWAGAHSPHRDHERNEVMKILLDAGADVHPVNDSGGTALMIAAMGYGTPEQVRMLQDAGAQ